MPVAGLKETRLRVMTRRMIKQREEKEVHWKGWDGREGERGWKREVEVEGGGRRGCGE